MNGKIFPVERREIILNYLQDNGSITVEEIAERLDVTPATIRRDLNYLEENNQITRTFGGAVVKSGLVEEVEMLKKQATYQQEKRRIAEAVMEFIEQGQTIILDAGTTNMEIAKVLVKTELNLNIVTNDVLIAVYLMDKETITVHCTGGTVQSKVGACLGDSAMQFLKNINGDIAFVGASAVDAARGISSPSIDKAALKRQFIEASKKKILVTDHSKFGKSSFAKVCNLDEFHLIVTDTGLNDEIFHEIEALGVTIERV